MSIKSIAVTAATILAVVAIASRVPQVRSFVFNTAS